MDFAAFTYISTMFADVFIEMEINIKGVYFFSCWFNFCRIWCTIYIPYWFIILIFGKEAQMIQKRNYWGSCMVYQTPTWTS